MNEIIDILDKNFELELEIDQYKSFIWAERFNTYGDFEIHIPIDDSYTSLKLLENDSDNKNVFLNHYASIRGTNRMMILEQFRITEDENSSRILIITGRSLETILMRRIVWGFRIISGNLQNGIKTLLTENLIDPTNPDRKIDGFVFKETQDSKVTGLTMRAQYDGDTLYDVISSICEENDIGFKIEINDDNEFEFSLYAGSDRSYEQDENAYIVFSKKNENLLNSEYLESDAFMKNVTLIGGEGEGTNRIYADFGSGSGLERREIFTDAGGSSSKSGGFVLLTSKPSDWDTNWSQYYINTGTSDDPEYESIISESAPQWSSDTYYKYDQDMVLSDEEYQAILIRKGRNTIKENKSIQAFNGQIDPFVMYIFDQDFFIGDVVEIEDEYGHESRVRVTEVVRSIDESGSSMYPTFSLVEEDDNASI